MGCKTLVWEPLDFPVNGSYWPPGLPRDGDPESLRQMYEFFGYEVCAGGELEEGYRKVALYVDDENEWTHAAHQEDNGEWTSKLGLIEDVRHKTPHCFGGSIYGKVYYFMRKKRWVPPEERTEGDVRGE